MSNTSDRRQYSFHILSEPKKRCQTLLLIVVFIQSLLIIGAIVALTCFPNMICKQSITNEKSLVSGRFLDKRKCIVKGIQQSYSFDLLKFNKFYSL